jgi:penicillin amidase
MRTGLKWAMACTLGLVPACSGDDLGSGETETGTGGTDGVDLDVFEGLSAPVEIVLDAHGIPHVYAQTDLDLFYAAGYQMATDRLFQMDLMRRRALGRQAEVLGESKVDQDEISRLFNFHQWGAANVERLREEDPEVYRLLVAWVAGVNRRIEQVTVGEVPLPHGFGPDALGYLPEPWTLQEHSAIAKLLMFGFSNSLERELLATIVQLHFPDAWAEVDLSRPAFPVSTMPPAELPQKASSGGPKPIDAAPGSFPLPGPIDAEALRSGLDRLRESLAHVPNTGSNNWAVDGRFTQNGRPMVAGDPHAPLDSPSVMYTQHLSSIDGGGKFDAFGWSFAGAAGIHLGHNRHLHWTATTTFADVMDIWDVEDSGATIVAGDETVDIIEREEVIEVAGAPAQTFVVREAPGLGIILPEDLVPIPVAGPGRSLLVNWTGFRATSEERSFLTMSVAENLDAFEAAVDHMEVGGFNFVAADAQGITYRVAILVPDRGPPSARPMPYTVISGDDPGSFWSDYLAPEKLPRSRAESRGWIATANNDPWGFTFDGDVSNDPWYYGATFAAGSRAQRLDEELGRLTAMGGLTVEDMQAVQTDTQSPLAARLVPALEEVWSARGADEALAEFHDRPALQTVLETMQAWDGHMRRDAPGALAFHLFLMFLTEETIGDELSLLYQPVLEQEATFLVKFPLLAVTGVYPNADALFENGRSWHLLRALERAAGFLEDRFGSVDPAGYSWGDMHGTRFDNDVGGALDVGWVPTVGGEDTINVSTSRFLDAGGRPAERFDSITGAAFRVVTRFGDDGTPEAFIAFPPGNSEDPTSPHFDDTLEDWVEGRYQPAPFRRADVDAVTEQVMRLEPEDHPARSGLTE